MLPLVLVGLVTAGVYLYFVPGLARELPPSCNVPSQSLVKSSDSSSDVLNTHSVSGGTDARSEASVEITDVTGQGDTLDSLLSSNLVRSSSVAKVAAGLASQIKPHRNEPFDKHTPLKPGTRFNIHLDRNGNLLKATLELDPSHVFHAVCQDGKVRAWQEDVVLDFKPEPICFTVQNNLIESVLKAGEGMELALKLTNVFRWDIDFQSESVKGDVCKILFERRYADDRPSGYGRILCAVYEGKKTTKKTAVLFNGTYYDHMGSGLKKNFLRSPLNVLRVTSRYGRRFHPILRVWRKHNGVDYGAPTGTPVWSVAGGTVTFAGWKKGYGRYVCIRHENGYESRYGHLSRILVRKGQRIKQRQRIGLVGQTGLATGPHLDFQLLAKGKHLDPLKVKMVKLIRRVPAPLKGRFASVARQRLARLGNLVLTQRLENFSLSSVP